MLHTVAQCIDGVLKKRNRMNKKCIDNAECESQYLIVPFGRCRYIFNSFFSSSSLHQLYTELLYVAGVSNGREKRKGKNIGSACIARFRLLADGYTAVTNVPLLPFNMHAFMRDFFLS